jgi:hypothetical protein
LRSAWPHWADSPLKPRPGRVFSARHDGHWQGPHDLRIFLSKNRAFAGLWHVVVTLIAVVALTDVLDSRLFGIPAGIAAGSLAWFVFMFGFAHGWIAEGD